MTQEKMGEILLEMKEKSVKTDELLLELKAKLDNHDKLLSDMKAKLDNHDELLLEMRSDIKNTNARIDGLENSMNARFEETNKELRRLSGSVARMEIEHGEKIQALFDIATVPLEKVYSMKDDVESHGKLLYEHDIKIRTLESKVNNS